MKTSNRYRIRTEIFQPQKGSHFKSWWASERVHLIDVCQGKGQCANFIGFRKKLDSARLNENVTAFIFCMNNFCCGSKYTETKINLKRPFIAAGGKGTTLEKSKNDQLAAEKLADPEDRSCVYKLENNPK